MNDRWLIVGLGNPGSRYERTRHNAGFWFLDDLMAKAGAGALKTQSKFNAEAGRVTWQGYDCVLCRPLTYMNESGRAVRAVADYYGIEAENILVAYDELDLPPGTVRLKHGGGHGGHNGLRSIFAHLGDQGFWRLRIGIGHPGIKDAVTPWVLSRAPVAEEQATREAIARAVSVMPDFISGKPDAAIKTLHTPTTDH